MQRNAHDALVVIGFCRRTVVFHGDKQRVRFAIRLISLVLTMWMRSPLKGHRYITVISDRDGRALALTDDRGTESLAGYLRTLTDGQLLAIKTLSMDMNAGYIRAARIHLPCAVEKIAFDRFHVAKQLGEVVDKTRQNEHPHLPVESWRQAKGTRFLWQYSDKWMTKSRQES